MSTILKKGILFFLIALIILPQSASVFAAREEANGAGPTEETERPRTPSEQEPDAAASLNVPINQPANPFSFSQDIFKKPSILPLLQVPLSGFVGDSNTWISPDTSCSDDPEAVPDIRVASVYHQGKYPGLSSVEGMQLEMFQVVIFIENADLPLINGDTETLKIGLFAQQGIGTYLDKKGIKNSENKGPLIPLESYSPNDILTSPGGVISCGTFHSQQVAVLMRKKTVEQSITAIADFEAAYLTMEEDTPKQETTTNNLFTTSMFSSQNYDGNIFLNKIVVDPTTQTMDVTLAAYPGEAESYAVAHTPYLPSAAKDAMTDIKSNSFWDVFLPDGKLLGQIWGMGELFREERGAMTVVQGAIDMSIPITKDTENGFVYTTFEDLPVGQHAWYLMDTKKNAPIVATRLLIDNENAFCLLTNCQLPSEYILITRTSDDFIDIDPSLVSAQQPAVGGTFEACLTGTKSASIDSIAFSAWTDGGVLMNVTQAGKSLWPQPIEAYSGWPGDFPFKTSVTIQPGTCASFDVLFYGFSAANAGKAIPHFAAFHVRGMSATVPVYHIPKGSIVLSPLAEQDARVIGSFDIFKKTNDLILEKSSTIVPNTVEPNKFFAYVSSFNLSTLPYSTAEVQKINLFVESTYDMPVEALLYVEKNQNWSEGKDIPFTIPAGGGLVSIELNESLAYLSTVFFTIYAHPTPDTEGTISFFVDSVDGALALSTGEVQSDWFSFQAFVSPTLVGILKIMTGEMVPEPVVDAYYYPVYGDYSSQGLFFTPKMVDAAIAKEGGPKVFSLNFWAQNPFTFTNQLTLKLTGTFQPSDFVLQTGQSKTETIFGVKPGDTIVVDLNTLDEFDKTVMLRMLTNTVYPSPAFVQVQIQNPITAMFESGVPATFTWNNELDANVFPKKMHPVFFGNPALFEDTNMNTAGTKMVFLDLLPPGENEFIMNHVCFKAQGPVEVKSMTYLHFLHNDSDFTPFKNVILDVWENKVYMKDELWSIQNPIAVFPFTKPIVLASENTFCASIRVFTPQTDIENAFFDVVAIEGETPAGEVVTTYLKNGQPLSKTNAIKGTNYFFIK